MAIFERLVEAVIKLTTPSGSESFENMPAPVDAVFDEKDKAACEAFVTLCESLAPLQLKESRRTEAPRELAGLLTRGRFQAIAVKDQTLLAKTRVIRPVYGNVMYELGEFLIEITPVSFAAYNLTRTVEGFHSPHINNEGKFCMTTGRNEIMDAINSGKLHAALYMIEEALWLTGTGLPYKKAEITNWPKVEV